MADDIYRDWRIEQSIYEDGYIAEHVDFDADWRGEEYGWVRSHPSLWAATYDDLIEVIDDWCAEQEEQSDG